MAEPGAQLHLRFHEGVSILIERDEQDLLHLDSQLSQALERVRRDVREHLRSKNLQDFLHISQFVLSDTYPNSCVILMLTS